MKNFIKQSGFLSILWWTFVLVFVFCFGFESGQRVPHASDQNYRYLVLEDSNPIVVPEEVYEIQPTLVADPLYGEELYRFYISQICEQYYPDVDPYVALAVLETESNYKPNLTSSAGAVGLMQWIPKWHSWRMEKFHLNDMWDPYTNIIVGIDILNDAFQSTGSWRETLYGYNHSTSYVNWVLSKAESLRGDGYFA